MDFLSANDKKITSTLQILSILAISSGFFGFVIVNLYFSLFGFWDFSFLKSQYFSAGLLFMFYMAIPFAIFYAFYQGEKILEIYKREGKTKAKSFAISVSKILIFLTLFIICYLIIILPIGSGNPNQYLASLSFFIIVWIFLIYGLVSTLLQYKKEINGVANKELNTKNIIVYFFAHFRLFPVIIAPFLFLMLFTIFIYPTVPRYFGGGKAVKAEIYLNSEFIHGLKGKEYLNVDLLYQSDDVIVVMVENEIFQIRREYIYYIKYIDTIFKKDIISDIPSVQIKSITVPE